MDDPQTRDEQEEEEEEVDVTLLDPRKVNWFKYVISEKMKNLTDTHGMEFFNSILSMLISDKQDAEIQSELIDLIGMEHLESAGILLEHRDDIKNHCREVQDRMTSEETAYSKSVD